MELTKRQWKALVTAYPLYHDELSSQLPSQSTNAEGNPRNSAHALTADANEDVQYIVGKVAAAFDLPTSDAGAAPHDTLHRSASTRAGVPVLMDQLLRLLFFGEPVAADKTMASGKDMRAVDWSAYGSLGASELYLLGTCAKEQARVRYYSGLYAALTSSLQALVAQHPCTIRTTTSNDGGQGMAAATRMMLPHSTNEERMRQSCRCSCDGDDVVDGAAVLHAHEEHVRRFTSALAQVPVRPSTTSIAAAFAPHPAHNSAGGAMGGLVEVCEACHEPGGDLFRCTQCNSLLHEICGGPHPPDAGALAGRNGTTTSLTMLCKSCRHALHVGSSTSSSSSKNSSSSSSDDEGEGGKKKHTSHGSSSSLRSSTSTSERAAIDAYFGPDTSGDEDTSLSGFIVHTDEDEEEEGEEGEADDEGKDKKEESKHNVHDKTRKARKDGKKKGKDGKAHTPSPQHVTHVSASSSSSSSSPSLPKEAEVHKRPRSRSGSAAAGAGRRHPHTPHHRRYKLVLSASSSSDDEKSVTEA